MSLIMEKTLASLPKLLSQSLTGGGNTKVPQRQPPPMDVQNFMKQIHKARSKSQEAAIVKAELFSVKLKLQSADSQSPRSLVRGSFTKVIFCHQLGYNAIDIGIEAIKLANQGQGFDKRLGYLVSSLLLHPNDNITILMTSTILKDLMSPNMTDNCLALKVAGELLGAESIDYILPRVIELLKHPQDLVKEKALHCIRSLLKKYPELLDPEIQRLHIILASRDPGVLMAVMNIFVMLTSQRPSKYVGLSLSFVHILDQINSRGFGSIYYHNMVALPWLQISLLKILCNLAQVDAYTCTRLEPTLKILIEKTKVSVPISLALLVESIQTATRIQASDSLLQLCSRCIMKLMASDSTEDMRYQGLGLLISLSKIKPSYTNQHQTAVMECLSSDDPAIQSRTTFLLYAMANTANVKVICNKLFEQLEKSTDLSLCREILEMVINLVERLLPDVEWYVSTNFRVLSHSQGTPYIDRVTDSLLKRIEQFHHHNEMLDPNGLANTLESLLCDLEKESFRDPKYVVRLRLLGVLAPLVSNQFQVERFFNAITPCVFESKVCDNNNAQYCQTMMKSPGQFIDGQTEVYGSLSDDIIHTRVTCVEIITKLVLMKSLDSQVVFQWLEKNNYKNLSCNSYLHGMLRELEDVILNPPNLSLKSEFLFHAETSDVDLSLSFLDQLVVQDLLKGRDCYRPNYVKDAERLKNDLAASAISIPESYSIHDAKSEILPSLSHSVSSNGKKAGATRRVKERWRDVSEDDGGEFSEEDDERFLFVDVETSVDVSVDKTKRELAEQLFAGLGDNDSTEPNHSPSDSGISSSGAKVSVKSARNIWEDDDDVAIYDPKMEGKISSFLGVDLHPFGISKKASHKPVIWHDEDFVESPQANKKMNDLVLEDATEMGVSSETSLYSMQEAPLYTPTYLYHQADTDSVDDSVIKDGMSVEQETGFSIYSEFSDGQSPVLVSPDLPTVSAVDTLTDSDPEGT